MSPGECYLMQLSAKITHSSLSELVIAIYRRTDTMKKMGPGNLNWTPNTGGEFQWKYSAPHAIPAPLLPHMSVSVHEKQDRLGIQSKILRSNLMFFSPMIGSAPHGTAVVCTLTVRPRPRCQGPEHHSSDSVYQCLLFTVLLITGQASYNLRRGTKTQYPSH